jgi:hypothetical protein
MVRAVRGHPQAKSLHCIFNVIKMNYFLVKNIPIHFQHPLIERHLFENITRHVFMRCIPSAATVFSVMCNGVMCECFYYSLILTNLDSCLIYVLMRVILCSSHG